MKPEIILGIAALAALAYFATRSRAARPVQLAPAPPLGTFAPALAPKSPIKKGAAPGAQAPPEFIPYEADDQSAYLQPIGSCELGSGISGTLYLNQFGEEVCA
jgi:hypothetical protein